MKKIISVLLILLLVFSFSACKETKKEDSEQNYNTKQVNNTNIADYVKKGVLDFSNVAIGMSVDNAVSQFHNEADMEDGTKVLLGEYFYGNYKGLKAREINNDVYDISKYTNTTFVYDLNNESNGIIAITCVCDVYGFQNGITMSEDVINSLGKAEKYKAESSELYFLPVSPEADALKYTFGENDITFYFVDDFLAATVISSSEYYDFSQTE